MNRRRTRNARFLSIILALVTLVVLGGTSLAMAQQTHPSADPGLAALESKAAPQPTEAKTEANLVLPDLSQVSFFGINGHALLMSGLVVCVLGLLFGFVMYGQLKNLPVHRSMREISELIYETCKTYLQTQGKFILLLEVFIGIIMIIYFGPLRHYDFARVAVIVILPVATGACRAALTRCLISVPPAIACCNRRLRLGACSRASPSAPPHQACLFP